MCFTVDLTDVDATAAVAASVEADLGPVEVPVNNVGWNGPAEFFLNLVAFGQINDLSKIIQCATNCIQMISVAVQAGRSITARPRRARSR